MFISERSGGYNRHGEQVASGLFLALFQCEARSATGQPRLYAAVRHVRLRQLGHFMMGRQSFGVLGRRVLSGAYGHDGLPGDATAAECASLVALPADVAAAYWAGDGWNGAGAEAPTLRAWAMANLEALRAAGKAPRIRRPRPLPTAPGYSAPRRWRGDSVRDAWRRGYHLARVGARIRMDAYSAHNAKRRAFIPWRQAVALTQGDICRLTGQDNRREYVWETRVLRDDRFSDIPLVSMAMAGWSPVVHGSIIRRSTIAPAMRAKYLAAGFASA